MKILFMTVNNNYHSPILLRNIFTQLTTDEISVVISTRSTRLGLRKIIEHYGWKYTLYKINERYKFKQRVLQETKQKVSFDRRDFLHISQVLEAFGIKVQQSININTAGSVSKIRDFEPNMIISLYFDQIFREPLLRITPNPPLNLHPSLLPAYAGSSPTFWVLANGETQTGISIHEMVDKVDKGNIIYQQVIPIAPSDTQFSLYRRCTLSYFDPLLKIINMNRRGEKLQVLPIRTDVKSSYYSKITNADIDRFLAYGRKFI